MFTLGGTPYPGIPTEELLDFLSDDHRMGIPQNCPQEIYTIMTDCWQKEREHRPTFAELSERIGKIMERKASEVRSRDFKHRRFFFRQATVINKSLFCPY